MFCLLLLYTHRFIHCFKCSESWVVINLGFWFSVKKTKTDEKKNQCLSIIFIQSKTFIPLSHQLTWRHAFNRYNVAQKHLVCKPNHLKKQLKDLLINEAIKSGWGIPRSCDTVLCLCFNYKSDYGRVGVVIDWNMPPATACVQLVEVRGTSDKQGNKEQSLC